MPNLALFKFIQYIYKHTQTRNINFLLQILGLRNSENDNITTLKNN